MSITASSQLRFGDVTTVSVISSLSGLVYYYWYLDGAYVGFTTIARKGFVVAPDGQAVVECLDSNNAPAVFNPVANAPAGYPATRRITFIRSIDPSIARYRVEQQENSGAWIPIALVTDDPTQWAFTVATGTLDDLATYSWRVIPINGAGNDGTALSLGGEFIVRTPAAPGFEVAFDPGTTKVTFSA